MEEISKREIEDLARKYDNWGRWGPDDGIGTMNLVTAERVAAAAGLVRKGRVFSLAIPLDENGPQTGAWGRTNPTHFMLQDGGDIASGAQDHIATLRYTDDAVMLVLQAGTQWDALAHVFHDGQMYNGFGTEYVTSSGAAKNSITGIKDRAVGRGVLLDIARHRGKPWLDAGEPIGEQDLVACAAAQGVSVGEGDFVLVRTGQMAQVKSEGTWGDFAGGPAPGLAVSACDFFCPRGVAAVAVDTFSTEVVPNETPEVWAPLHIIMLVHAGIHLGEIFDLEELAEDCAEDGVYEFMFVAPPLTVSRAVGSAINPQAIK